MPPARPAGCLQLHRGLPQEAGRGSPLQAPAGHSLTTPSSCAVSQGRSSLGAVCSRACVSEPLMFSRQENASVCSGFLVSVISCIWGKGSGVGPVCRVGLCPGSSLLRWGPPLLPAPGPPTLGEPRRAQPCPASLPPPAPGNLWPPASMGSCFLTCPRQPVAPSVHGPHAFTLQGPASPPAPGNLWPPASMGPTHSPFRVPLPHLLPQTLSSGGRLWAWETTSELGGVRLRPAGA